MDHLTLAFYRMKIEIELLKRKGDAFQDLFASVMERRYPKGDFVRVRPWGKLGDRKNDGYLNSARKLYQVYAPNELTSAEAIKKITEDFTGALPHWEQHFDEWVFVHNSFSGLGPDVTKCLLDLRAAHADRFKLPHYPPNELLEDALKLPEAVLLDLFGPVPSQRDIANLQVADIQPLLAQLEVLANASPLDLREVPVNKLERNLLSLSAQALLRTGELKSPLVGRYYTGTQNPMLRDRHAAGFRARYLELRDRGLSPDQIFTELQGYAGGPSPWSPARLVAILAVMAYFFEACDIFERPED